jgi:hypothetical protein
MPNIAGEEGVIGGSAPEKNRRWEIATAHEKRIFG